MVESLGKRFSGRRAFGEDLERIASAFYEIVRVDLKG